MQEITGLPRRSFPAKAGAKPVRDANIRANLKGQPECLFGLRVQAVCGKEVGLGISHF